VKLAITAFASIHRSPEEDAGRYDHVIERRCA